MAFSEKLNFISGAFLTPSVNEVKRIQDNQLCILVSLNSTLQDVVHLGEIPIYFPHALRKKKIEITYYKNFQTKISQKWTKIEMISFFEVIPWKWYFHEIFDSYSFWSKVS